MEFRVAEPCEEPWSEMEPRGEGRHCARCARTVVDLSTMTRAQAESRVRRATGERLCVRLGMSEQAEAVFLPPRSRAPRWAGGVVLASALAAGCNPGAAPPEEAPIAMEAPEPCDLGPPMQPVGEADAGPTVPDGPTETRAVLAEIEDDGATPNAEQRRLTTEKHRPPVHHMMAGMMIMPSN